MLITCVTSLYGLLVSVLMHGRPGLSFLPNRWHHRMYPYLSECRIATPAQLSRIRSRQTSLTLQTAAQLEAEQIPLPRLSVHDRRIASPYLILLRC